MSQETCGTKNIIPRNETSDKTKIRKGLEKVARVVQGSFGWDKWIFFWSSNFSFALSKLSANPILRQSKLR